MPVSSSLSDEATARTTATEASSMLNRRENLGTAHPRGKLVEDEVELLEQGDRSDEKSWKDTQVDGEEGASGGPLSMRDKRALTLLIALCELRLLILIHIYQLTLSD